MTRARILSILTALAFTCIFAGEEVRATSFPLPWRWANPTPHGNNIIDIAGTDQLWVQVAERGQFYTSTDLLTWTPGDSPTSHALRAVTFFKGLLVISGENGTILSGPSPTTLSLIDLGTTDWLEGVAASPQVAVAVGDNAAIYSSSDAVTWRRQGAPLTDWLRSVAYGTPGGTGLFVAVGESGAIATSPDGARWQTQKRFTSQDLNTAAWFDGEFWVLGDGGALFQSSSGTRWQAAASGATNTLNAFAGLNAFRLAAGEDEVRLRVTPTLWNNEFNRANPPPPGTYLSAVATANSFLLCGRTGMMVQSTPSTGGSNSWTTLSDSPRNWLWDVKHFPNLYLAVGDLATILSSTEGTTWTEELPPDAATNSIFLGIGGRTNLAVAVGNAGTIITSSAGFQSVVTTNSDGTVSTNQVNTLGIFWQSVTPPTKEDLQGIGVFNDLFIASGGAGTILTSSDAVQWTKRPSPTTSFLSSVEAFPNGVVAVGKNGTILSSSDGLSWVQRPSQTTNWIYRVRYLGGQFVAVGQNGTVRTSTDGTTWVARDSGKTNWLTDVQFLDNTYFAVGDQGTVLSSPDATIWTDRGTITGKSLFGAANDGAALVTVGVEGIILRSQIVPPGAAGLVLSAAPPDATVSCDAIPGAATMTATDSCDPSPVVTLAEVMTPGNCPYSYKLVRTWTATDACGNQASKTQTLTVVDTTPPVVSAPPADATVSCDAIPGAAMLTATDSCDPSPVVTLAEVMTPGNCQQSYKLVRTWTATDACGNQSSKTQTLTVVDTTPPVLSAPPSDATVSCDAIPGAATLTATDSCDPSPVVTLAEVKTPGNCQQSYKLVRTWTATDACGNQTNKTQTLTIVDTTPPVLSAPPADATVSCDAIPGAATMTATDSCDPSPVVTLAEVKTPGNCPQSYKLVRTWTATDACGNQASKSQTLTVVDSTPPVLSAPPSDATVSCDAIPGAATLTATDSCDFSPVVTFAEIATPGSCAQGDQLVRTWTATDACGNQSSKSQTLTVSSGAVAFLKFPQRQEEALFMFSGPAGQTFTLERSPDLQSWTAAAVLRIDPSGTLLFSDSTPNSPRQQFFRTRIQP